MGRLWRVLFPKGYSFLRPEAVALFVALWELGAWCSPAWPSLLRQVLPILWGDFQDPQFMQALAGSARRMLIGYSLVMLVGVGGGIILGRLLGGTMLSFLAFDERGRDAVPPYEIVVNRAVLVSLVLVLVAGVLAIALAFSIVTRRLRIPSELRVVD